MAHWPVGEDIEGYIVKLSSSVQRVKVKDCFS